MLSGTRERQARIAAHVVASAAFARLAERSPLAVSVLLVLHAHDEGGRAWASHRFLAHILGCWRKSVYLALKVLCEDGWIRVCDEKRNKWRERVANRYDLLVPGDAGEVDQQVRRAIDPALDGATIDQLSDWIFRGRDRLQVRRAYIPLSVLRSTTWAAIRSSGTAQRLVLLLDAFSGGGRAPEVRSTTDLARMLGCTPRTLRACIHAARLILTVSPTPGKAHEYRTAVPADLTPVQCPDPSCVISEPLKLESYRPPEEPARLVPVAAGPSRPDIGKLPPPTGPPHPERARLVRHLAQGGMSVEDAAECVADMDDTSVAHEVRYFKNGAAVDPGTGAYSGADHHANGGATTLSREDRARSVLLGFHRRCGRVRTWEDCNAKERKFALELADRLGERGDDALGWTMRKLTKRQREETGTLMFLASRMRDYEREWERQRGPYVARSA